MENYYMIDVEKCFGGHETFEKVLHRQEGELTQEDINKILRAHSGSSEDDYDEDRGGYKFDGNLVLCLGWQPVTKSEFKVMSKFHGFTGHRPPHELKQSLAVEAEKNPYGNVKPGKVDPSSTIQSSKHKI